MTVFVDSTKVFFTGNGVTASHDFPFKYFSDSDIEFYKDGVLVNPDNYTITRNPSGEGGTLTPGTIVADEVEGLIQLALPYTQEASVPTVDRLSRGLLEEAYDKLTLISQQLKETSDRSLKIAFDQNVTPDTEITLIANKALVVNADGDGFDLSEDDFEDVVALAEAQVALATTQASNAATSASAASSSATNAANQVTLATAQVTLASGFADAASASATAADGFSDTASDFADLAELWAEEDEDVEVETGKYSAKHWAQKAADIVTNESPLTTKGDIYIYGTDDDRLPIGTNGHYLTPDSAQARGMKWTALPTGSESTAGLLELATTGEVATGTDTTRALSPGNLTSHPYLPYKAGVPHFLSGRYYGNAGVSSVNAGSAGSGIGGAISRIVAVPFFVPYTQAFDRIACYVSNADGNDVVALGVYSSNSGKPGSRQSTNTISSLGTGAKEATIALTLTPGWWWLAAITADNTVGLATIALPGPYGSMFGVTAPLASGSLAVMGGWVDTTTGGSSLPASFISSPTAVTTAADLPALYLRAV